ncbi:MAG: MmgE/PrpD family protein [Rhodospirillaceae bacterium]|jgi:2-methylcitrate dehydratase
MEPSNQDTTAQRLVEFAQNLQYEDLPDEAIYCAKARILSTLAVSLAAYDFPPVQIAEKVVPDVAAGPRARILGSLKGTSPEMAAFVNSAMVRCLDMSDTAVMAAVSHPADAFPAILAIAEAENLSGKELLLAMAIIYEAQVRFVEVVPYNHHGWDQTPVVAMGAALGTARLMGLDEEKMHHALSLAITPNLALNQTRTGKLSMWKGMAGPQGARQGVFAAQLAREGMTGPEGVFEGKFGLWNQMMNGEQYDLPIPKTFKDHIFAVQQTVVKAFPIRFNCHLPVFCAIEMRDKVNLDDVKTFKIESIRQAFDRWMDLPEIWKPETRESADHSLPCTVALGLLDGGITPATHTKERYKDQDVLELMSKMELELPDEFADLAFETRCCRITATLKNGESVTVEKRLTQADDVNGPSREEVEGKFNRLTEPLISPANRQQILDTVWALETAKNVENLIDLTRLTET